VPSQLLWKAAAAGVCVLVTTSAGFAQTAQYRQPTAVSSPSQYQARDQYPSPATLVGTYRSNDFFPSPLVLNITGADGYGNLSGSISGMRSYQAKGEADWRWENWQNVFGRDGTRALYRDGKVNITFKNGATYTLENKGNMLAGKFTSSTESNSMTFLKSQGLASGR
jgi:hypothetical protein